MKLLLFLFASSLLVSCSHINELKPSGIKTSKDFFNASWAKNLDPIFDSGNLPIALQSPAIDDGVVYVGDNNGKLNAYELENGRLIWSVADGSTFHSAPIIYKDKIIYGTVSGRVIARNAKNAEIIYYNVDLGAPVETAGSVYNGKVFFQLRNHQVFCLDIETGKVIWAFKKSISNLTTLQRASTPIVYNNKLYVGFADGSLSVINIDEGIQIYETKLSTASKFLDVDSTPFVFENKIIIGPQSGNVLIIEPNTGKIIRRAEFTSLRSPIVFENYLVFGTNNGEIVFCDKELNITKRLKISNVGLTSLNLFKDSIVVGNLSGEVFAIDPKKLLIKGKFEFGHAYSSIFSDLVSKEGHLLVLSSRNRLFSFY
jgi:outer membrane protein assembly factor BamB